MRRSIQTQRGAAAIYLALLLVPLFGMVFLAIEGSRYVQKKNRLADASEAAVMALSMADRTTTDAQGRQPSVYNRQLSDAYLNAYIRNIKEINDVTVVRTEGEEQLQGEEADYIQYQLATSTKHDSWLANTMVPSFDKQQDIVNRARAKSYPVNLQRNVDIVFVSDFSGSMNNSWDNQSKISVLKREIAKLSANLLSDEAKDQGFDHRLSFVPFNLRTQEQTNTKSYCVSQLIYKDNVTNAPTDYDDLDWYSWSAYPNACYDKYGSRYRCVSALDCSSSSFYCPVSYSDSQQNDAKTIQAIFDATEAETRVHRPKGTIRPYPDPLAFIDIEKSVSHLFEHKLGTEKSQHFNTSYKLFGNGICQSNFSSIKLTTSKSEFDQVQGMNATGGTAVFQGIMRGAQILAEGIPGPGASDEVQEEYHRRAKMLLILSDGTEDPYTQTFTKLVNAGMCGALRQRFADGELDLYIGVVGIDFKATDQDAFVQCVGEANILDASKPSQLEEVLETLIQRGARTDGISRLYYRHSG